MIRKCNFVFLAILLLSQAFLINISFAEYLWNENGNRVVAFDNLDIPIDPVKLTNGHSILYNHTVPASINPPCPWLEVIFDDNGVLVDTFRYPDLFADFDVIDLKQSQDGGRLMQCYKSNPSLLRIAKFDASFNLSWTYDVSFDESYTKNKNTSLIEYEDVLILAHNLESDSLAIKIINPANGEVLNDFHPAEMSLNKTAISTLGRQDTLRIAVSGNRQTRIAQFDLTADGFFEEIADTVLPISEIIDLNFFGENLLAFLGERGPDILDKIKVFNRNGMIISESVFEYTYLISGQYTESGFWLRDNYYYSRGLDYYEFQDDNLELIWHYPDHYSDCAVKTSDGGLITLRGSNDFIRYFSSDGELLWEFSHPERLSERMIINNDMLYFYHINNSIRSDIDLSDGDITQYIKTIDSFKLGFVARPVLYSGYNNAVWMSWYGGYDVLNPLSENYSNVHLLRINPDGSTGNYFGVSSSPSYSYKCYAANDGGMWIIGSSLWRVDRNGLPLWDDAVPDLYKIRNADYFGTERESAPYPAIKRVYDAGSYMFLINDDGSLVDEDSIYVSDSYQTHSVGCDENPYFGINEGRLFEFWRATHAQDVPTFWSMDLETFEQYDYEISGRGGVVSFKTTPDEVTAVVYADSLLSLRTYDIDGGDHTSNILLFDDIDSDRQWFYMCTVFALTDIYAQALMLDDYFFIVYKPIESENWYLEKMGYDGSHLGEVVTLPGFENYDKLYHLDRSADNGFWVSNFEKAYLFDNNLNFMEGYENGLAYNSPSDEYAQTSRIVNPGGNLFAAWTDDLDQAVTVQCLGGMTSSGTGETNLIENPSSFKIISTYPNPFNSSVKIKYSLDQISDINLKVFNIQGQEVTTLDKGKHVAGNYSATWNSIDNHGQPVASGVYFIRLEVNQNVLTKKIVLVK